MFVVETLLKCRASENIVHRYRKITHCIQPIWIYIYIYTTVHLRTYAHRDSNIHTSTYTRHRNLSALSRDARGTNEGSSR